MPNLSPVEIVVVLVVALLVLGPQKLPEAARQVGRALTELRRWSSGVQGELRHALEVDDERTTRPSPSGDAAVADRPSANTIERGAASPPDGLPGG